MEIQVLYFFIGVLFSQLISCILLILILCATAKLVLQRGQWWLVLVDSICLGLLFLVPCWSKILRGLFFFITQCFFVIFFWSTSSGCLTWRNTNISTSGFISFVSEIFPLLQVCCCSVQPLFCVGQTKRAMPFEMNAWFWCVSFCNWSGFLPNSLIFDTNFADICWLLFCNSTNPMVFGSKQKCQNC